jgi:hypothetical protein
MDLEKEIKDLKAHAKVLDGWVRDRSNELKKAAMILKDNTDRRVAAIEEVALHHADTNAENIALAKADALDRMRRATLHLSRRIDNNNRAFLVLTKRIEELENGKS